MKSIFILNTQLTKWQQYIGCMSE